MNGELHDSGTVRWSLKKDICICLVTHLKPRREAVSYWALIFLHLALFTFIFPQYNNYHFILNCIIPPINQKHLGWEPCQIRSGNPQQQSQSKAGKATPIMAAFLHSLSLNQIITISNIKTNIKQHQNLRLFYYITLEMFNPFPNPFLSGSLRTRH